jgi:hypothetical protein
MRSYVPRRRSGFALAIAMVAMVVIGALITGAFWVSNQEFRSGRNALVQERALAAAEYGQNWVLANWDNAWNHLLPGDTMPTQTLAPDGGSSARVRMTRLNNYTYWVVSEGSAGAGSGGIARRRTNAIVRLDVPNMKITGAITSAGTSTFTGAMSPLGGVNGNDVSPTGWAECAPAAAPKPSISNDAPASEVTTSGTCGSIPSMSTCFTGSGPKIATDATAGDPETYNGFGEYDWADLTGMADAAHTVFATGASVTSPAPIMDQVMPTAGGGTCSTADTRTATASGIVYGSNWGEPLRSGGSFVPACQNYYPVIWIRGTTAWSRLAGGTTRGQGILLVEGNLEIAGFFQFYGLIITKGTLRVVGGSTGGPKIIGAVMTGGGPNTYAGAASVQYSSCAVASALNSLTPKPVLVPERAWANMY